MTIDLPNVYKLEQTYLETVFDEGLGVEKTMEENLPCCHCHLSRKGQRDVCTLSCISWPNLAQWTAAILTPPRQRQSANISRLLTTGLLWLCLPYFYIRLLSENKTREKTL